MKPTRRNVLKRAEEFNADVIIDGAWSELDVEIVAPEGHHWASDGVHALVGHQNDDEKRPDVWRDLLERMEDGVEPCDRGSSECRNWNGW